MLLPTIIKNHTHWFRFFDQSPSFALKSAYNTIWIDNPLLGTITVLLSSPSRVPHLSFRRSRFPSVFVQLCTYSFANGEIRRPVIKFQYTHTLYALQPLSAWMKHIGSENPRWFVMRQEVMVWGSKVARSRDKIAICPQREWETLDSTKGGWKCLPILVICVSPLSNQPSCFYMLHSQWLLRKNSLSVPRFQ